MYGKQLQSNRTKNHYTRRSGVALIWAMVVLLALCAIASLAVDLGRVHLAKTQLRAACDAAALAAAQEVLWDPANARPVAIATAKANRADGTPVVITTADVQFVKWDEATRTYTVLTSSQMSQCNAVRVTASRTAAGGNPIDLPFAKMIGKNTCDARAEAIAIARPWKYAMVGLDYIKMDGRSTNSYRTKDGTFSNYGSIASNGNIILSGSSLVNGDALYGIGKTIIGADHVTGISRPVGRPLVYPVADPGNAATVNNNGAIASYLTGGVLKLGNQKSIEIPGGTYYLKGIELQAGSKVTFTGPVTIYCNGPVDFKGHASTYMDDPDNLKLNVLGTNNKIDLNGGSSLYAAIYAPASPIKMAGNADIYGFAVGKSIDTTGNAAFHYDLALRGGVALVK